MKLSGMTCKELVWAAGSQTSMGWSGSLKMRIHLLVCVHCRKYLRQIEFLGVAVRRFWGRSDGSQAERLNRLKKTVLDQVMRRPK